MGDSKSGTRRSIPPGPAAAQDASGAAKPGVTVYTLTLLVDRHGRVEPSRVDAGRYQAMLAHALEVETTSGVGFVVGLR